MSKRILYMLFALSIGLNLGMIGMTIVNRAAQPGPPPLPGPGPGPADRPDAERIIEDHVMSITRHLDLDEVQAHAIREIMEKYVPTIIQLRAGVESANGELSRVFAAPEFDPEYFLQRAAESSQARSKVDSLAALILAEEAAVLTPEQRKLFAQVAPNIHTQPQGPRGREGPPPPDGARPESPPPR